MAQARTVLFGAFDRHNLGDLLFAHIAGTLCTGEVAHCGLVDRDLTACGGHRVTALPRLLAAAGDQALDVIHVGGELLTCSRWEAALMLQTPEDVARVLSALEARPQDRAAWVEHVLGPGDEPAYIVPKARHRSVRRVIHNGIGGVGFGRLPEAMQRRAIQSLSGAGFVGVRDHATLAAIRDHGIDAQLMPDCGVRVRELFAERIETHGMRGEPAQVQAALGNGYLAVQFAAEYGDDATLRALAGEIDRVMRESGVGVVLFRAGAAPWHDTLAVYRRFAEMLRGRPLRIFESPDIWDICALIAGSRGFCGTSLHARLVALAYALPRVSFAAASQGDAAASKVGAFIATWEPERERCLAGVEGLGRAVLRAFGTERAVLQDEAGRLADGCRRHMEHWARLLAAA